VEGEVDGDNIRCEAWEIDIVVVPKGACEEYKASFL
jgi:hypothetical protein